MRIFTTLIAALSLAAATAHAQYPQAGKPIRLVVPFAPGGSSEIISRAFAQEMSKVLGTNVYVENKGGAAGNIAMQDVKGAPADGYTLILGHVGTLAVNPAMFAKLPYDAEKDFVPVTMLVKVPNLVVVNAATVQAKTLKEYIAMAKAKPNGVNYGSAGNGSSGHLAMEYLNMVAGMDTQHVPYKGTGPMLTDLMGGRLESTFTGAPPLLQHVKSGKLRALAVGSLKRTSVLPDVPTVAESGFPGFETSQWYGLMVPAGTPKEVIDKLYQAAVTAGKAATVAERLQAETAEIITSSPKEFADFIKVEAKRWGEVVKKANIKAE
jgi:tripartite-type tricarboxylate transporter receptor subunit TctC